MSVMSNEGPMAVEVGPFLPAPVVLWLRGGVSSAQLAAVVGEVLAAPLVDLESAYSAARAAVADLESHRPGGLGGGWRDALAADAEAYGTGTGRSGGRPRPFSRATRA